MIRRGTFDDAADLRTSLTTKGDQGRRGANSFHANYAGPAELSSHYVVGPNRACQILDDDLTAWHAGDLDYTHLGIYIAQSRADDAFTDRENQAAAAIVRDWCLKYNLPMEHLTNDQQPGIIGNSETSSGKSRRLSDPGLEFNWDRFIQYVRLPAT
jgi:N-acetyl-anhydromuramyl-L-alanine amidase AmpD